MRLAKLELSGFKSFAKPTTLEFPVPISAIVGPNGSGKSNVAEAIRWVMGEQSMKSLRGKRGEDLIFSGSPAEARLGKASVVLSFDNSDEAIPLDFPEVQIERRIFRDGTNEYLLNGSTVRLRDIVELAAKIGLGETKHNIIGQGEVDRWLFASVRERKEILEEALGLKVYQLKKAEAERKFESTQENMRQAEVLIREIAPHLKFLKHQAEKAKTRGVLETELHHLEQVYFGELIRQISEEEKNINAAAAPLERDFSTAEDRAKRIRAEIERREKSAARPENLETLEKEVLLLEEKRQTLEREFGRAEGRLLAEREKLARPLIRLADASYIKEKILALIQALKSTSLPPEETRHQLETAVAELEALVRDIEKGSVEVGTDEASRRALQEFEAEATRLKETLKNLSDELKAKKESLRQDESSSRNLEADLRKLERELHEAEETRAAIRAKLDRLDYDRVSLNARREELSRELALAGLSEKDVRVMPPSEVAGHASLQEMFKKIERLRGKLEEVGGIDATVVKEYQDTEARHAFLTGELADLKQASASLEKLMKTLSDQMAEDFTRGFKKLNEGFNEYFRLIFGGGKAKLVYQTLPKRRYDEEAGEVIDEEEYGIDIEVDIPRKRIKSLSMLSGGERALTSIALLFAMVSVNPPPFLVLDETDAALDEANSQKYANTLAELSKRTQLIIITHNRETMMRAGILYGVTMGDNGISRLVSIKFEEGEQYVSR